MPLTPYAVPVFDVGGARSVKTTNRLEIIQTVGMHDTAVVTLRGEDMSAPNLVPGTTVMITYGWKPLQLDVFYGYIDHIGSSYEKGTPTVTTYNDVVCLGASYAMKDPVVGAWSNTQASSLVASAAATYGLSSLVQNDDYTWPQLSAPGCSAWEFLVSLANKLGYVLACNKTQVRFVSVDETLNQYLPTMPTFMTRASAPNVAMQSINNFQATTGESFPMPGRAKARVIAGGIDQRTGQVVNVSNSNSITSTLGARRTMPFFNQVQSDLVVRDQEEAQAALSGLVQHNRFNNFATASLAGDASVAQGMPIYLTGINPLDNGVWWVEEAVHRFTYTTYSTDVSLGRDSTKDRGLRPISTPYARRSFTAPPTVLIKNRWRAAHQSAIATTAAAT
jgi:phage protein D